VGARAHGGADLTSADDQPERLALLVHEVRSPVAALVAIAEAVRDGAEPAVLRELAGLAVRSSRSIERILDEAAPASLRIERVDLVELVRDAVTASVLAGGLVRLSVDRSRIELDADPIRLRQAVDNLIRNALDHSGSSDEVVVRAEHDADSVLVSVSDTGRGIAPRDHARIFERGLRLDSAAPGSGLGLDVVREIVGAHGGTVTIASELGRGATFTIALPGRSGASQTAAR
jgi:two-component system, OmpR family, sensor histidine kinase BaeS